MMTTKPTRRIGSFSGLADSVRGRRTTKKVNTSVTQKAIRTSSASPYSARSYEVPVKLIKVSHAMMLIYIALLLAFSIVAVQNNRIRKAHTELLANHDALYLETQVMRLEASEITSPGSIRYWAKAQGMIPYYSSAMELEQLEPSYILQENTNSLNIMPNSNPNLESVGQ